MTDLTIDCRDCNKQFAPADCLTIYCDACVAKMAKECRCGREGHFAECQRPLVDLSTMTQDKWNTLTPTQKEAIRSKDGLSPQLIGLEGFRVEVVTDYGETRRFIVGRSTGWIPCHIEISRRSSHGGIGAERHYKSVKALYRAR